nr:hypothetical protein [Achromobacter pulmonis]
MTAEAAQELQGVYDAQPSPAKAGTTTGARTSAQPALEYVRY